MVRRIGARRLAAREPAAPVALGGRRGDEALEPGGAVPAAPSGCTMGTVMTPEFWAIIGIGTAIAGLFYRLDLRISRLDDRMVSLVERMAKLEGAMDGFMKGFSEGRRGGHDG